MLTAPANVKNLKMMIIYVFNMFHTPPAPRQHRQRHATTAGRRRGKLVAGSGGKDGRERGMREEEEDNCEREE